MSDPLAKLQSLTGQLANVSEALRYIENPDQRLQLLKHYRALLTEADALMNREFGQTSADAGPHSRDAGAAPGT